MKAILLLGVVFVCVYFLGKGDPKGQATAPAQSYAVVPTNTPRDEVKAKLRLKDYSWGAEYGTMTANFTFQNDSDYDVKDIEIRCDHSAPSGTRIDSNKRTIYEIFRARSTKAISKFSMGFIHSQAQRSGCRIADFVVLDKRPPPANGKPTPK